MKNKKLIILMLLCFPLFFTGCAQGKKVEERFPSGNIRERYTLLEGKFDGKYTAYYENGKLRGEGFYKKNIMVGEWRYYYSNGNLQSIQRFEDNKLTYIDAWDVNSFQVIKNGTGTMLMYSESGKKMSSITYKNYKPDGTWFVWYENGNLASEMYYNEGKRVGIWHFWDMEGNLKETENNEK